MQTMDAGARSDQPSDRAFYYAPEVAFDRPVPPVPATVFSAERARAFDAATPTGFVELDQSAALGCPWPATTPAMLARYVVLQAGDEFHHNLNSTGQVYYVIRGAGVTRCCGSMFEWRQGDAFCLPGNASIDQESADGAILLMVSNEPELSYLRAVAADAARWAIRPIHFLAERIAEGLHEVHGRNGEQRAAGKSVILVTELMQERRLTTPTLLAAVNSLEAGGDQRPHRHSSAALTLCIDGEDVFSRVDGVEVPWEPDTLIVTPPNAMHSHHNRGTALMRSFVVQDTGLHTELRSVSFAWTD